MSEGPENREKRVRRQVLAREHLFLAVTQRAFRRLLGEELADLSFSVRGETEAGLEFSGRIFEGWRANLLLRSSSRIYCRTLECRAGAREELFRRAEAFPWELWLSPALPLQIQTRVRYSRIQHEGEAAETLSQAIEGRLSRFGISLPGGQTEGGPSVQRVLLRLRDNRASVSLDMSGEALYNRGYRREHSGAPLREDLAAALLRLLVRGPGPLVDGMTGSGTLAIEGALRQRGRAPGANRDFAFQHWPSFRRPPWEHLKKQAAASPAPDRDSPLLAIDIDPRALDRAVRNARRAGVGEEIRFLKRDFFDIRREELPALLGAASPGDDLAPGSDQSQGPGTGYLVLNPPYGRRLAGGEAGFFRRLGRHVRETFPGFRVLVLFPSPASREAFGGRPESLLPFRHGGLRISAGIFAAPDGGLGDP